MVQHRSTQEVLMGKDGLSPCRVTMEFLLSRRELQTSVLDWLLGPRWACSVTFLDPAGEWTQESMDGHRAKSLEGALSHFLRQVETAHRLDAPPKVRQTALASGMRRMAERIRAEQATGARRLRQLDRSGQE